ncbi:hypothetical protein [Clavibacter michiganensis]|uniref:hypothetical protein n=1 Tax=Clavibacter michiganensis TaxID=28447 RepID=UPI0034642934
MVRLDAVDGLDLGHAVGGGEVRGVEDRGVARPVGVEDRLARVADDVAGGVGLEDHVGQLGLVAGAGRGVEHLEALAHRDHDVPVVARGVEAGELLGVEVRDGLEGLAVEDEDAALVGDGDAGSDCLAGSGRGPGGGGALRGGGGAGRERRGESQGDGGVAGPSEAWGAHGGSFSV